MMTALHRGGWILLGFVLVAARPVAADVWVQFGPDQAIYAATVDPNSPGTAYTGGDSGTILKTTDAGVTWAPSNNGIPSISVRALVVDPTDPMIVYAGTLGAGVYKSTNGGANWGPVNTGLAINVRALAINPSVPTTLYAGTDGVGVYKTTNGGGAWTQINTGITSTTIAALAVDPSAPNRVYAATLGSGMLFTSNGGTSWVAVNLGPEGDLPLMVLSVAVDPTTPGTVYAGTKDLGVYKTLVGNGFWYPFPLKKGLSKIEVRALVIDPVEPTTIYAATSAGMYRFSNRGTTWTGMSGGLTSRDVRAVAIDQTNPKQLYAATTGNGSFALMQVCPAAPQTGCGLSVEAGKSLLTVKDKTNNNQDSLVWKWLKGDATVVADFGDPLTTTSYSLCVYDESAVVPQLVLGATAAPGDVCPTKPCWKVTGTTGFKFKNGQRTSDGIDTITLKAGAAGKAQAVVQMKGVSMATPTLPLTLPVRAQLVGSNGKCWETHFSTVRKNQADQFDARGD